MSKYFHCECGNNFVCLDGEIEEISEKSAEKIGWRKINGKWICPYCCGNTTASDTIINLNTDESIDDSCNANDVCECYACRYGLKATIEREKSYLKKYGWFVHFVGNDPDCPYSINIHTHGLKENFNHKDFQVCIPLEEEFIHGIFCSLVEKIKEGSSYKSGEIVTDIIFSKLNYNPIPITFAGAFEGDHEVLRVIFPDSELHLKKEDMIDDYGLQWEGTTE